MSNYGFQQWSVLQGKPYVTVSAKGITNGLSNIVNDGADFGPDSLQSNGVLTQTSGIQEAVNYLAIFHGGHIMLLPGKFILSANTPQTQLTSKLQVTNGYYAPFNTLINFPTGTITQVNSYEITGTGANVAPGEIGTYPSVNNLGNISMIDASLITNLPPPPTKTSLSTFLSVLGCYGAGNNYTTIKLSNIAINLPSVSTGEMSGIIFSTLFDAHIENVTVAKFGTNSGTYALVPYYASTAVYQYGIYVDAEYGNVGWINAVQAANVPCGIGLGPHMTAGSLTVETDLVGLMIQAGHKQSILRYDTQQCGGAVTGSGALTDNVFCSAIGGNYHGAFIGLWDGEDNTASPGDRPDLQFETGGGPGSLFIGDYHMEAANQTINPRMPYMPSNAIGNGIAKIGMVDSSGMTSLSIQANPPVSATVYQNLYPFTIHIMLPVYVTTSGTAGYVTIAKGSTSTPTVIGNQFVNGSTSSTSTEIINLIVPAGWYYEFTASGVTFGTASIFPA